MDASASCVFVGKVFFSFIALKLLSRGCYPHSMVINDLSRGQALKLLLECFRCSSQHLLQFLPVESESNGMQDSHRYS